MYNECMVCMAQSKVLVQDCFLRKLLLSGELDVVIRLCGHNYRWFEVESTDLIVLLNLAEYFLSFKGILLVNYLTTVLEAESLGFEVWSGKHPSEDDKHTQHHDLGLSALILFGLVLGDEEEDDQHMSVSEEHVEPFLIALEGELLDLQVEVLLDQQLLERTSEVVSRQDDQSFNFSPIFRDLRGYGCGCISACGGSGRPEVQLLEEGEDHCGHQEDVDSGFDHLRCVHLIIAQSHIINKPQSAQQKLEDQVLHYACAADEEITTLCRWKGAIEVKSQLNRCAGVWFDGDSVVLQPDVE